MKFLIAISLIAIGAVCVGAGIAEFVYAEYQQHSLNQAWHSANPAVPAPTVQPDLPSGVVARMTFERLSRAVYVLGDEDPGNLKRGPVWLRTTSRFGGEGNTVVAGHRDTHFRFLKDVQLGDRFIVEDGTGQAVYRINGIRIVSPEDRSQLAPVNERIVTLVTCYPFHAVGPANRRMIVRAELVSRVSTLVSTN